MPILHSSYAKISIYNPAKLGYNASIQDRDRARSHRQRESDMPRGVYVRNKRGPYKTSASADRSFNLDRISNVGSFGNQQSVTMETDEEVDARLRERFEVLDEMTQAAIDGHARAVIVSGPAGLGKSYSVERLLESNNIPSDHIVKGYVRPTGLYKLLYQHRSSNSVLVFDDADSIFNDDISLTFLKAVLDSSDRRIVSYLAETRLMDDETAELIPRSFQFDGTIIFITNLDMNAMIERGHKLAPHLEALISRAHYIDLTMKTQQDYLVRIDQVVKLGLLKDKDIDQNGENTIMEFVRSHKNALRELSLRMVLKIANNYKLGGNWQRKCRITCCR